MKTVGQLANRHQAMMLYSAVNAPHCHRVRIVLAEKAINHDLILVDENDTPEELKDLNPYNEVPTLVDRDLVLYQPQVIMEYLDERFPHPPLMPVDPVSRSRYRLMLYRIERDWYSLVNLIERRDREADAARKALRDSLLGTLPVFEQKPFFLSEEFSLLDCTLAPLLWRLPFYEISLPAAGKSLQKYADRLFERPAFRSSLTDKERELR